MKNYIEKINASISYYDTDSIFIEKELDSNLVFNVELIFLWVQFKFINIIIESIYT